MTIDTDCTEPAPSILKYSVTSKEGHKVEVWPEKGLVWFSFGEHCYGTGAKFAFEVWHRMYLKDVEPAPSAGVSEKRIRAFVEETEQRLSTARSVGGKGETMVELLEGEKLAVYRELLSARSRIAELEKWAREADEYLSGNPYNYVGSGSILHRKLRSLLPKESDAQGKRDE